MIRGRARPTGDADQCARPLGRVGQDARQALGVGALRPPGQVLVADVASVGAAAVLPAMFAVLIAVRVAVLVVPVLDRERGGTRGLGLAGAAEPE